MTAPTTAPIRTASDLVVGDRVRVNPALGITDPRVSGALQVVRVNRTRVHVAKVNLADDTVSPAHISVPAEMLQRADGLTEADLAADAATAPTTLDFTTGELVKMTSARGAAEGVMVVTKVTASRVVVARLGGSNTEWKCIPGGLVKVSVAEYLATATA